MSQADNALRFVTLDLHLATDGFRPVDRTEVDLFRAAEGHVG